jgi:hypothetical protein
MRISESPFLPMAIASLAASAEVLYSVEQDTACKEVAPGIFEITISPSPDKKSNRETIRMFPYQHRDGDLELERCSTCRAPKAVSQYRWDTNRGLILNVKTGRLMCLMSPQELDPIFSNLIAKYGETIPRVVVEAQKSFTKSGFYSIQDLSDVQDFGTQLALRGLGNLKEMDIKGSGLRLRVGNVALPMIIVGLVQGLFELAYDCESETEWELSEKGGLEMEIISRG